MKRSVKDANIVHSNALMIYPLFMKRLGSYCQILKMCTKNSIKNVSMLKKDSKNSTTVIIHQNSSSIILKCSK